MGRILSFFFRYLIFWVLYFILIRLVFITYHIKPFSEETLSTIAGTFLYGLRMDLSMASYFSLFPFLIISLVVFKLKIEKADSIVKWYSYLLLGITSLLTVIDVELFSFWGYRLDGTPLKYLNTPGEMLASSLSSPWYLLIPLFVLIFLFGIFLYQRIVLSVFHKDDRYSGEKSPVIQYSILMAVTGFLVVPIRGGLQQIPMNESTVYFSSSNLANQAAVNLPWAFIHSLLEKSYSNENPYEYTDYITAGAQVIDLYENPSDSTFHVLKHSQPNVLIILWESFTAKADVDSVTPEFNTLKKEGIFFSNVYATGDRSDKGIVGVLSGYPALPVPSIIMNPNKSMKLPSLARDFVSSQYTSSFYYGGELAFANMNTYLVQNKFDRIISIEDFDKKDMNSKWGAHDEVVLRRLKSDLDTMKIPFFSMIFTLSSHEPFEIPMEPKYKGKDKTNMFLSSLNYTDRCLGDFIREAKKTSWWDNTLVVIIADHGHVLPGSYYANHSRREFKIPMLWLGGALEKKDTIIHKIASQTDLAVTLNTQLGRKDSSYLFSRNILSKTYHEFAYYTFNDGFGYIRPEGYFLYDNISRSIVTQEGIVNEAMIQEGRAIQQVTYRNYLNK
jgi:phosphoglycerol transferase MdoB-like AlkP superfamily enzyme